MGVNTALGSSEAPMGRVSGWRGGCAGGRHIYGAGCSASGPFGWNPQSQATGVQCLLQSVLF